ncbi:MAG: hypothetical protein JSV51_09820 [Candidatus Bathyarchaeota archaeon]|nr:MAG: hypothetical protein JSV51_09820 [Candidatus Bathyarchaeota archaeon]
MEDLIRRLGKRILIEGEHARFRNERKRFVEFVETITTNFPQAVSTERTLKEPYRSLAFFAVVGQRPLTSLLMLEIFLGAGKKPLSGKEIGERLADELGISRALTTKGGNYKDRVGDLISTFIKIGILESVFTEKSKRPKEEGFRIRKSAKAEVREFVNCIKLESGVLNNLKPRTLEALFKMRFDRIKHVIKSGSEEKHPFSIGKIMKSLLSPKLDVSFETAVRVVEEIEPKLKTGMTTLDIQSTLYNALKKRNEKAAENYRLSYPKVLSIAMSDGETEIVNYKLVKTLIDKEAKLKLTHKAMDQFASTVYNVITRNPQNYQDEPAVREYINALIRSEYMPVRSDTSFAKSHLETAVSALEGCHNSLESDEVSPARGLLEQFLEQICLVALAQLGYLPLKNIEENVGLISNLLKEGTVREELKKELKLDDKQLSLFQRIRYMMQKKETANRKSLARIVDNGEKLVDLCYDILQKTKPRVEPEPVTIRAPTVPSSRISTGYDELDDLLLGGIPEYYATILTSPSCDERDLLIKSFLEAGVRNDQTTFYLTIEGGEAKTLAEEFPQNFYLFLCNPEADAIMKDMANVFKQRGVDNLIEIGIALDSAFRKLEKKPRKTRRACIEIVSDALLQHHATSTRRWLTALIPKLKSRGFTTLAVMNPHMHAPQEVQAIIDLFQGEIHIYRKKTEKRGMKNFLKIEKMYNQEYLESELPLKKEKMQK